MEKGEASKRRWAEGFAVAAVSAVAVAALFWLRYPRTDTLGFVTGAACVYYVVREDLLNFPIGIANDFFLLAVFVRTRLFGNAALQVLFAVLGVHGWHQWLHGGADRGPLEVRRMSFPALAGSLGVVAVGTAGLTAGLWLVKGSAPVLDSLSTALQVVAQYLLNRKYLENWYLWIAADVLTVYLTWGASQLTALLYVAYLGLCVAGLVSWQRTIVRRARTVEGVA